MEDKSYGWFLSELSTSKSVLRFLETGICRGSKLLNWFYSDANGVVSQKSLKENSRTKLILNWFLNHRLPMLGEYNPDKVICYLYHRKGRRIVSAKDAVELAENQLHGLQVCSIHMALNNSVDHYKCYRMHAWNENNELQTKLTYGKFIKDKNEQVKDQVITEKATSMTLYISDLFSHRYVKFVKSIKIDMILDSSGQLHVLKVKELTLSELSLRPTSLNRAYARSGSMEIKDSSSEEVSIDEGNSSNHQQMKTIYEKEQKKKDLIAKVNARKINPQNSDVFLEMIAKTFDRERKARETQEILEDRRKALEKEENMSKRRLFHKNSLKTLRETVPKKNGFNSINDLLYYLERTRPRTWVKDNTTGEYPPTNVIYASNIKIISQRNLQHLYQPEPALASHKKEESCMSQTTSHRELYQQKLLNFLSKEEKRIKTKLPENFHAKTPSAVGRDFLLRNSSSSLKSLTKGKSSDINSPAFVFK